MAFCPRKFHKSSNRVRKHRFMKKIDGFDEHGDNSGAPEFVGFGDDGSTNPECEWITTNLKNGRGVCESVHEESTEEILVNEISCANSLTVLSSDIEDSTARQVHKSSGSVDFEHSPQQTLAGKIQQWAVDNLGDIKLKAISQILEILKSEGHSVPPTVHKLLGFEHRIKTNKLLTNKDRIGTYVYLGIANGLNHRILSEEYNEDIIRVLIFIDGMKVYQHSKGQLWPIVMKISHPKYTAIPFVVALYYGDSKPKNVDDFLKDFVNEASKLITEGITITGRFYRFQIIALIGDSLARAYLKCIKSPTGFFSCERCTVKGVTVNKKRVFPDGNCSLRTKETFENLSQIEHHLINRKTREPCISPLLKIPGFDPIKQVPLDVMHLLYLNVMKNLGEKWILREKNEHKLSMEQVKIFTELMTTIHPRSVPSEFQRNTFDVLDFSHWKATQYSFLLLYSGPIVLQFVLDAGRYQHFLLLCVASRILCNNDRVVKYHHIARQLLCKFVRIMPTFYGNDCQTMVIHDLIHLCDDAEYFKTSLSEYAAFWGEDYIGKLKKFVSSKAKPIPQIVNRLEGLELSSGMKICKRLIICDAIEDKVREVHVRNEENFLSLRGITYCDMILRPETGNNVVQLRSDDLFIVKRIMVNEEHVKNLDNCENIFVEGFRAESHKDIFLTPCPSRDVGIFQVNKWSKSLEFLPLSNVNHKCMLLKIKQQEYAVSLLHT